MLLYDSSGSAPFTKITLQTRMGRDIDNLQPWEYSHLEWKQLDESPNKYERLGAVRVSEMCPVYNCHGLTFGSRRTQVDGSSATLDMILRDDGFEIIAEKNARTGDVVIYYIMGLPEHSGIVVDRVPGIGESTTVRVWSKWGKANEWVHPLHICPWAGSEAKFYRMTRWARDISRKSS